MDDGSNRQTEKPMTIADSMGGALLPFPVVRESVLSLPATGAVAVQGHLSCPLLPR